MPCMRIFKSVMQGIKSWKTVKRERDVFVLDRYVYKPVSVYSQKTVIFLPIRYHFNNNSKQVMAVLRQLKKKTDFFCIARVRPVLHSS